MHDHAASMEREADAMEKEARDGGVWCPRCSEIPCGRYYHCLNNLGPR